MLNYYSELTFFVLVIPALCLYRLLSPRLNPEGRAGLLGLISMAFLALLRGGLGLLPLALAGVALLYLGMRQVRAGGRAWPWVVAWIVLCAAGKHPVYVSWLPFLDAGGSGLSGWGWMGFSYFVFRAIDAVLQAKRKGFDPGPCTVGLLGLYFVPYVSGPVNRIAPLARDLAAPDAPLTFERVREAVIRMGTGIVKMLFFAKWAYFLSAASPEFQDGRLPGLPGLTLGAFAYYLYIYFDFSGYTDVAIALSGLFGVKLPENFNRPFLAGNIQEFWNRWHMSLSTWFRDYLFFPSLRALRMRLPWMPAHAAQAGAFFLTFLVMGMWHGDAVNWVVYGLFHGLSMSLWSLKRSAEDSFAPDFFASLRENPAYVWSCRAFTFCYVSFGMLLMLDFKTLHTLLAG
ncbi:MBOAT family O-acyltransferase [Fundidesulfovibrio terrae]|uniref:MBOAT family O-acyltransferase n=1 Tax=Fundidesulfovibrio terrae TaxID=2922866 RepID=UPI001FB02B24|nr:MBOAT family O-acyltransferase [Fundidesulfovibrio terrae]